MLGADGPEVFDCANAPATAMYGINSHTALKSAIFGDGAPDKARPTNPNMMGSVETISRMFKVCRARRTSSSDDPRTDFADQFRKGPLGRPD